MKAIFLRHGQSEANVKQIIDSTLPGASLTQQGINQVKNVREKFGAIALSKCYCSPFKRTVQTFEYLDFDIPLILENRIREFDYGKCNQSDVAEVSTKIKEFFKNASLGQRTMRFGGNGETFQEFNERVISFWEELQRKRENVLVITHESVIIEILKQYSGDEGEFEDRVEFAFPFVFDL
ncbi:MAG: histidine phosphatase family protein [Patescibacteria group bacterium]